MKYLSILIMLMILVSCGANENGVCALDAQCTADKQAAEAPAADFVVRGSVSPAFELTVNGESYSDIEDYFTKESARLPDKVTDAGYEGYKVRFDAAIGYSDLTNGMTVFISGKEKRGFQTKTLIAKNDTFAAKLPVEAAGDTYQIKASKRISVILTKGTEVKKFCYNFAAVDLEVPYEMIDRPIILSNFKSTLTSYECKQDAGSDSLRVPETSNAPAEYTSVPKTTAKIKIYDNLRDLLTLGMKYNDFGTEFAKTGVKMTDSSSSLWTGTGDKLITIVTFKYLDGDGMCDDHTHSYTDSKNCVIILNSKSKVIFQSGIRIEYLNSNSDSWPSFEDAVKLTK